VVSPHNISGALRSNPRRDEQGRLYLRVAVAKHIRQKETHILRVCTVHGEQRLVISKAVAVVTTEPFTPYTKMADMLVAMCDLLAIRFQTDYVIWNPDRLETLRAGRYQKPAAKQGEQRG
jgi:hypothetical protein